MTNRHIAIIVALCLYAALVQGLSSPAVIRAREVRAGLAWDQRIKVTINGDGTEEVLTVDVDLSLLSENRAQAVATLAAPYANYEWVDDGLKIETTFKRNGEKVTPGDLPTKQQEAVDKLTTALKGNPMFYKYVEIPPKDEIPATYFFLFQPRVIQWYTDDMAQWKGHATEPAANLLSRVYGITSLVLDQGEGLIFGSTRACNNCSPIV